MGQIEDKNVEQSKQYSHQLLEALRALFLDDSDVSKMLESHQRIVIMFNHLCKKGIPYRSAAVADFALGTVMDDT